MSEIREFSNYVAKNKYWLLGALVFIAVVLAVFVYQTQGQPTAPFIYTIF